MLFHCKVQLDLSTNQASPGQEVDITVISKPYSYVGLLGIDQNAFTLRSSENDLNVKRIFSELSAYEKKKLMPTENHYGTLNSWEDFTVSDKKDFHVQNKLTFKHFSEFWSSSFDKRETEQLP